MDEDNKSLDENTMDETPQVVEVNDSTAPQQNDSSSIEVTSGDDLSVESEPETTESSSDIKTSDVTGESDYANQPVVEEAKPEIEASSEVGITPDMVVPVATASSSVVVDKPKKKRSVLKIVGVILLVWLIVAAPVGAYLWRDKLAYDSEQKKDAEIASLNAKVGDLQSQLDAKEAENSGACSEVKPSSSVIENIKASVNTGNTQPLEGYMTSGVDVILAASEGIGETDPTTAVKNVTDFIKDAGTWNFALDQSTLDSYKSGDYKQYFPNTAVVGKSSSGKVISFSFDCTAKIGTVFLSNSADILE